MLENLSVKNFALFKNLTIDFENGLNVFLGETGSGKSLVFDAINFVVGSNNDKTLIRSGEDQMRVDALFSDLGFGTKEILKEFEMDYDEILLTRTLSKDGKSSYKLNGMPATASMIKSVSKTLIDGLVQHEGLELLKTKNHLLLVDKFGGEKILEIKTKFLDLYQQKKELEKQIGLLGGSAQDRERTLELLQFQLNEINSAELEAGEDDLIREKLDFLNNSEKIYESISSACESLNEDNFSALNQLNLGISKLGGVSNLNSINEARDRLVSLKYELDDVCDFLEGIKKDCTFDEKEFDRLDKRNDLIKSLKKKYGGSIEEVLAYGTSLQGRIDDLVSSENRLVKLNHQLDEVNVNLTTFAKKLSDERKLVAKDIEKRVIKELSDLGMKGTAFKVEFKEKGASQDGIDDVEFTFSANVGEALKNLSKTASGGEISRIMLALKNIFASIDGVKTLLFDEVDAGISGEIGNMVAEKLLNISSSTQVLCISHLPQVASLADNFYLVEKNSDGVSTTSCLTKLEDNDDIVTQIAKLVSGKNVTQTAIENAKELRNRKK